MLEQLDRGWRVMIVDDNPHNRELIAAYLDELGVDVVEAGSGEEALGIAAQTPPDVVVLDIMMPRMSGFQVCEELKARDPGVVVLLVTALNESGDVERGIEAGADDFLVKPVNKAELNARVRVQLHVRSLRRRLEGLMSGGASAWAE